MTRMVQMWEYGKFVQNIKNDKNMNSVLLEKKNELGRRGWEFYQDLRKKDYNEDNTICFILFAKRKLGKIPFKNVS